jgi:hypothetical protein
MRYQRDFILILLAFLFFVPFTRSSAQTGNTTSASPCYASVYPLTFREYTGTYIMNEFYYVNVKLANGELSFKPLFWTTTQHLRQVAKDSFEVKDHERFRAVFRRDSRGQVTGLELFGYREESGHYRKQQEIQPLEYIFKGAVQKGMEGLLKNAPKDTMLLVRVGAMLVQRFASRKDLAHAYLQALARRMPYSDTVFQLLGENAVARGKRDQAGRRFLKAYGLNPANEHVKAYLKLLGRLPYSEAEKEKAWKVPFSLDNLFALPTKEEVEAVKVMWSRRDLSPKDVHIVATDTLMLGYTRFEVHIVAHRVHGSLHYGAALIPEGAGRVRLPVVMELKGVSPSFFPMNLNTGLYTHRFLCEKTDQFIYIVPSFRGERLIVNGKEYLSEGDKSDSWDGASDDALAFLNAALAVTPEADDRRIAAFGKSRGGTLALLAGIRDKRINTVIDWAGPADWFRSMDEYGWTEKETTEAGLHQQSDNYGVGGQTIDWALKKSIRGEEGLKEARLRLIASSPLYFAEQLPYTQLHYGAEDLMVPLINGKRIAERLAKGGGKNYRFFVHSGEGHDLDRKIAFDHSRSALLSMLKQ